MDHFTHNIIRNELRAITTRPPPDPADWAFSPFNDRVISSSQHDIKGREQRNQSEKFGAGGGGVEHRTPDEWVRGGLGGVRDGLAKA